MYVLGQLYLFVLLHEFGASIHSENMSKGLLAERTKQLLHSGDKTTTLLHVPWYPRVQDLQSGS